MDDIKIGFIGAGTLGKGLALALAATGFRIVAVSSRSWSSAEDLARRIHDCDALTGPQEVADRCDLVFVTTPDGVISQVASQVQWRHEQGVAHCSGAGSLDILEPAARTGAITGSLHPFQTLACLESPEDAVERLKGTTFAIEGQGWLLGVLEQIVRQLGGQSIHLKPEDRAMYHASGVIACGSFVALLQAATDMWQAMGVQADEALPKIIPMVNSTLANVSQVGLEASLTGPVVRGDIATIQRHLDTLESRLPRLILLYCTLCLESLPLVRGRVGSDRLMEMEQLFKLYITRYISRTHT